MRGGNDTVHGGSRPLYVLVPDALQLAQYNKSASPLAVVSLTAGCNAPIDSNGSLISFPPIRSHHSVLWSDHMYSPSSFQYDYPCASSVVNPMDCSCVFLPSGFAFQAQLNEMLTLKGYSMIIDARQRGSQPLAVYMQYATRFTIDLPIRAVHKLLLLSPMQVTRSYPADYYLPSSKHSMLWYFTRMPQDGELFQSPYFHSHHIHEHSILMLQCMPAEAGLEMTPFDTPFSAIPVVLDDFNMSVVDVKKHLFASLYQSASARPSEMPSEVICHSGRNVEYITSRDPSIVSGLYGRFTFAACRQWTFQKGDPVTLVVFALPVESDQFTYKHDTSKTRLGGLPDWNHIFSAIYYTAPLSSPLSTLGMGVGGHRSYYFAQRNAFDLYADLALQVESEAALFFPENVSGARVFYS